MQPIDLSRLHAARMRNDAVKYEMQEMSPRFEALRSRHEDGTAPIAIAAHQLFQTPDWLAHEMVELADIRPGHSVLEPSAGLGRLLRPILAREPASVTACELSADCAGQLFREFPTVTLLQGDFLDKRSGTFDRIVMNPPFTMRSDIKHVLHAVDMLAPGGVLVGLCMAGSHREKTLRPLTSHWQAIPAGTFRKEGTEVGTVLFKISLMETPSPAFP